MDYTFKRLDGRDLAAAMTLAAQYRALNQPTEAESICRDVLEVDPQHHDAIRTLGLALTDQFTDAGPIRFDEAVAVFARLPSAYEKMYLTGVAWERQAKARLQRGEGLGALHSFEHALQCFAEAEKLGEARVPDPILHWNHCVRLLTTHPVLVEAKRHLAYDAGSFGD